MKIDVIIPVYRPTEKLHKVLYRLCRQTHLPEQIILLHTRDGIKLDVSVCKDRVSVTEIPILEKEFDHGRTREQGIWMSDADIVVMMTQDAVPADPFLLEKLSEASGCCGSLCQTDTGSELWSVGKIYESFQLSPKKPD